MDTNPNQQPPSPQPAVEQTPVPPKPSVDPKTLFIAIAVFIVVVIGLITYILAARTKPTSQPPTVSPTLSQPSPTPNPTANWNIYRDSELKYEFQYPPNWIEPSRAEGDTTFAIGYLLHGGKGPKDPDGTFWITLGYISQAQLNTMGITYCAAHMNDSSRCESTKIDGANSVIDWGIVVPVTRYSNDGKEQKETQTKANVLIPRPKGGVVIFELQPVVLESKKVFYQILSTFKFSN